MQDILNRIYKKLIFILTFNEQIANISSYCKRTLAKFVGCGIYNIYAEHNINIIVGCFL